LAKSEKLSADHFFKERINTNKINFLLIKWDACLKIINPCVEKII
jgi:hypothetical protein